MITKIILALSVLLLSGCSHRRTKPQYVSIVKQTKKKSIVKQRKKKSSVSTELVNTSHPTMKPYVVRGKKYYPTIVNVGSKLHGIASWYGPAFNGRLTSNGETYNMWASTAAHKTLPMNTIVRVTNKSNGRSTIVRINDRGPFVGNRIIDLSKKAASDIGMIKTGTAPVVLEIIGFQESGEKKILSIKELKKGPSRKVITSYAVQVASFRKIEGAIITQEKYDGMDGYRAIIKDMTMNNQRIFRVWLAGFKSEQEARDFIASGRVDYSFIVSE